MNLRLLIFFAGISTFSYSLLAQEFGQKYKSLKNCLNAANTEFTSCLENARDELQDLKPNADNYIVRGHYLRMLNGGCEGKARKNEKSCINYLGSKPNDAEIKEPNKRVDAPK